MMHGALLLGRCAARVPTLAMPLAVPEEAVFNHLGPGKITFLKILQK